MNKRHLVGVVAGLLMVGVAGLSEAGLYDPTSDFSINNGNPNGVWSYGWMPSDFSTFTAHTSTVVDPFIFELWYTPGLSGGDYSPQFGINASSSATYGIAPGQLDLHPGPGGQASVLRFTVPTEGLYDIDGQFFAGDGGIMDVGVRQGSNWLWNGIDAGAFSLNGQMFSAGEAIDFLVYGGYGAGNTGLAFTISSEPTSVPEPATILLFGTGIAGLALKRRNSKQHKRTPC